MSSRKGARDVQAILKNASEQLEVGEMLHGQDFSLAAVMSAAEIGDPRLDAGDLLMNQVLLAVSHVTSTWKF